MNKRDMTSEYRLAHWAEVIRERKENGFNIREYCKNADIKEHIYYCWRCRLRKATQSEMAK